MGKIKSTVGRCTAILNRLPKWDSGVQMSLVEE